MSEYPAITKEQLSSILPEQVKKSLNDELIENLNKSISDPAMAEILRDNILGYVDVLKEGKFKIDDYLNAVRYVSYKMMGNTNLNAYIKTFPDRYQAHLDNGTADKDIASYVTAYNKRKLVNLILEQTLVPFHVLNQDIRQKALGIQLELATTAKSEKVRSDAANSILVHTKGPETTKMELDVKHTDSDAIKELRAATQQLAIQQRDAIRAGVVTAGDTASSRIIDAEFEECND